MRILSCHIENFGKLSDLDFSFSDGLNVICRENGWGKSTLAAFIKAMLYGLDGHKKRDLEENERKRFTPWQGGIFGGQMEFETRGKRYTVNRTFGDSPAKDTFELRDCGTNLISHDFSGRLGEELFKLNSTSFYRSIFISQSDCQTSSTDDIHAKISNLADNTGDIDSYEAADDRLKKKINSLSPKLRTGSLFKLSEEIAELRRKVAEGKNLTRDIADCENRIAQAEKCRRDIAAKRDGLEARQGEILKLHELKMQKSEWERLKKQYDSTSNQLDEIKSVFPAGIPDEESLKMSMHSAVEMKSAESLMNSYRLSDYEKQRLAELKDSFGDCPPSAQETDSHLREAQELHRITEKYNRLKLTEEELERVNRLNSVFADDTIEPLELAAKWNERNSKKAALSSKQTAYNAISESVMAPREAAKRRSCFLIAAGIVLMAAGVTFFVMYFAVWFIVAAAAGIFLLAAGIFFAVLTPTDIPEDLRRLLSEIQSDEEYISDVDELVEGYLASHGIDFNEPLVPIVLQELCGDRRDLDSLVRKLETAGNYLSTHDMVSLRKSISDFLNQFGIQCDEDNLSDQLHEIKESASEYLSISEKSRQFHEAESRFLEKKNAIMCFLDSYSIECHDNTHIHSILEQIRDSSAEIGMLSAKLSKETEELNEFEQNHDTDMLITLEPEDFASVESVNEELRRCTKELEESGNSILSLHQNREELYKQFSVWESDNSMLREKTERQTAETLRYTRLVKTRELLRTAKENMIVKYVVPVRDAFRRYYEILAGESADNFHIDADINITVDELGRQRDIKSLSAGYRDLSGICLRLALADAMYPEEKPALILDDPFTNLDDLKVEASKVLLTDVIQNYQVIYFTCSGSRADSLPVYNEI